MLLRMKNGKEHEESFEFEPFQHLKTLLPADSLFFSDLLLTLSSNDNILCWS